ncbi:ORF17 [Fowl aviadenovirus C]|uniref:ORF17 n=2 Tax=Fowl aviadenovirus C TaxID=190063 RepID=A0A0H3ZH21_9ADEN|nr:ORF44 [Fowl aviadenovirus 10]AKN35201.1 ORF17 [Fowl aviadenovirus C]QGQ62360.1 ORF17 [Fowl aviadenovirus C]QGQ62410.1 ORF17 [Fowl aviadenovirus C]QGQ62462.1 ORF17 [Fowl aviadenovirus C]
MNKWLKFQMTMYLVFGAAVPEWCQRPEVFRYVHRGLKFIWTKLVEKYSPECSPLKYMFGLQEFSVCECHATLLICIHCSDQTKGKLEKCRSDMRRFLHLVFYRDTGSPCQVWLKLYDNQWCPEQYRMGRWGVTEEAFQCLGAWRVCTGLRTADDVNVD